MRIYSYGALPPIDGADMASKLLREGARYYNVLVEIERARRGRYRAIERTVVSEVTAVAMEAAQAAEESAVDALKVAKAEEGDVEAAKAALKDARKVLKDARDIYRVEATPLRDAAALVKQARDGEKVVRKEKRVRNRDDDAIASTIAATGNLLASKLHASDSEAEIAKRKARGDSGLPWGTYTLIEESVIQACKASPGDPHAPHFRRWDGEGRVGTQPLAGGLTLDELEADTRFRLQILPRPDGPISKRGVKRRHALASIRVAMDEEGNPVWATWPVIMHRPLPEGCIVRTAWALKRRVGSSERWQIQITVDDEIGAAPRTVGGRTAVALDLGWRLSAGYRVGYFVDENGYREDICAPLVHFGAARRRRKHWDKAGRAMEPVDAALIKNGWKLPMLDALRYLDGIRAARDDHFNLARAYVREYLNGVEVPTWLREDTATMGQWRSPRRLAGLLSRWEKSEERPAGDTWLLEGLRAWEAKDRHLWDWEAHGRERILRARLDHYRCVAGRIAKHYGVVLMTNVDLSEPARRPKDADVKTEGRQVRVSQKMCAPSTLRAEILNACKREGVEVRMVDPAKDTSTCHVCGTTTDPSPSRVDVVCGGCGARWDRDANACVNRLRKAGFDVKTKLRACIVEGIAA